MDTTPALKRCTVSLERMDMTQYMNVEVAPQQTEQQRKLESIDVADAETFYDIYCPPSQPMVENSMISTGFVGNEQDRRKLAALAIFSAAYLIYAYAKLLVELREGDSGEQKLFRDFLRMSFADFEYLLELVKPLIEKKDTHLRRAIPAGERLALTPHYLATGQNFHSLQYVFRLPQCSISKTIPAVLDAIWSVLKDEYLRVRLPDVLLLLSSYVLVYHILYVFYIL